MEAASASITPSLNVEPPAADPTTPKATEADLATPKATEADLFRSARNGSRYILHSQYEVTDTVTYCTRSTR